MAALLVRIPIQPSRTRSGDDETPRKRFQAVRRTGTAVTARRRKERQMYISGGVLALIVIVVLLIWLL